LVKIVSTDISGLIGSRKSNSFLFFYGLISLKDWAVIPNCAPCKFSKSTKKEIIVSKNNQKNKKELLFLEPIKPEMSVDTIFTNLVRILEAKGIKIYPDNHEKGAK
jgi:hypothetical protein